MNVARIVSRCYTNRTFRVSACPMQRKHRNINISDWDCRCLQNTTPALSNLVAKKYSKLTRISLRNKVMNMQYCCSSIILPELSREFIPEIFSELLASFHLCICVTQFISHYYYALDIYDMPRHIPCNTRSKRRLKIVNCVLSLQLFLFKNLWCILLSYSILKRKLRQSG